MHGERDSIDPLKMGKQLFEKANYPKKSYFTKNDTVWIHRVKTTNKREI